jgi:hypothetical protein
VTVEELLVEHGALGLEKQDVLLELLGEHRWDVDLGAGTVDFGMRRVYHIQLVGTESSRDSTWLWAWANDISQIPSRLLTAVTRVREFGRRHGVAALTDSELSLGDVDTHVIGAVSCGLTGADGYYVGHHDHGALLFLLSSPELATLRRTSILRMTRIFSTFISTWPIENHRQAFAAYARSKGCQVQESREEIAALHPTEGKLIAEFGESNRLVRLSTS